MIYGGTRWTRAREQSRRDSDNVALAKPELQLHRILVIAAASPFNTAGIGFISNCCTPTPTGDMGIVYTRLLDQQNDGGRFWSEVIRIIS